MSLPEHFDVLFAFITPIDPPGDMRVVALDEAPPKPGVVSNWNVTARPKRKSMTEYAGEQPWTLDLPCFIEGFGEEIPVDQNVASLENLVWPTGPKGEPPILRITGPAMPMGVPVRRWVMTGIDPGEEIRRGDGARIRAFLTLKFLEYVPGGMMLTGHPSAGPAAQSAAQARSSGSGSGAQTATPAAPPGLPTPHTQVTVYKVKKGDTLPSIANLQLGDGGRWHEIYDLNHLKTVNLKEGQFLNLPPKGANPPAPNPGQTGLLAPPNAHPVNDAFGNFIGWIDNTTGRFVPR